MQKIEKGKSPEEIAEDLEEEVKTILPIYNLAIDSAPEFDSAKIFEKYYSYNS